MSDSKKSSVDDLVQEMRWLNENTNKTLVELMRQNEAIAEWNERLEHSKKSLLILGVSLSLIGGIGFWFVPQAYMVILLGVVIAVYAESKSA